MSRVINLRIGCIALLIIVVTYKENQDESKSNTSSLSSTLSQLNNVDELEIQITNIDGKCFYRDVCMESYFGRLYESDRCPINTVKNEKVNEIFDEYGKSPASTSRGNKRSFEEFEEYDGPDSDDDYTSKRIKLDDGEYERWHSEFESTVDQEEVKICELDHPVIVKFYGIAGAIFLTGYLFVFVCNALFNMYYNTKLKTDELQRRVLVVDLRSRIYDVLIQRRRMRRDKRLPRG